MAQSLGRYGWGDARVAQRASYTVKANWKLVTENYQECYHCRPSHPEFARFHASERPDEATVKLRKAAVDKAAAITDVRVEAKSGGRSGDWNRA